MLQKSLTKFRTLSLAFVMAAMLMVGTMAPVHQAAAQEVSAEQRAAMLVQINQLMELIMQLMVQLQTMQAIEGSPVEADIEEQEDAYQSVSATENPDVSEELARISYIKQDAFIESTDNTGAEWGRFIIEFEVTAEDEDIWIKNSLYRTDDRHSAVNRAKYSQNPKFSVLKNGRRISSGFSEHFTFMQPGFISSADEALPVTSERNENFYVVKKGKTEKFTLSVMFAVQESAEYKVQLEAPLPVQTASGKRSEIEFRKSSFVSEELYLESGKDDDEEEELDPTISLISPNGNQTFDKSKRNDDIVIKWEAEDVPQNTNVIIEIEAVEVFAGTFITGGVSQVLAKEGRQEHRKAIDVEGTLGAGEYKVKISLEECHSLGCNKSYSFGPLKEDLKTYDQSRYAYFTVVDSESADVRLSVPGYRDSGNINLDREDRIYVNHYPVGNIDECLITGEYERGEQQTKSSWANTIKAGQYGRTFFTAVGTKGLLEEVRVECEDRNGQIVATDSISFTVDPGDIGSYEILLNGEVVDSNESATEADAQSSCRATYNNYDEYNFKWGDVVECEWNGKVFERVDGWKG